MLTVEEKQHIGSTEVKLNYKGCPRITSSGRRAKSWELNYPAIAFMLNGGYYNDYATVMGIISNASFYLGKPCVLGRSLCGAVSRVVL